MTSPRRSRKIPSSPNVEQFRSNVPLLTLRRLALPPPPLPILLPSRWARPPNLPRPPLRLHHYLDDSILARHPLCPSLLVPTPALPPPGSVPTKYTTFPLWH